MASADDRSAVLAGIAGSGYAVVESLTSLGNGKRCDGIFVPDSPDLSELESLAQDGAKVPFEGMVYHRHLENRMRLEVKVTRVAEGPQGLTAEFTAREEF